jgi:hypothetical protein
VFFSFACSVMSSHRRRFQEFHDDFVEDMTQLTQEKSGPVEEVCPENQKNDQQIIEIFILQRGSITKVRARDEKYSIECTLLENR